MHLEFDGVSAEGVVAPAQTGGWGPLDIRYVSFREARDGRPAGSPGWRSQGDLLPRGGHDGEGEGSGR
jgi:hypothetical protein